MIETITKDLTVVSKVWNKGNSAWGHESSALYQGRSIATKRVTYHNRTWEAYQFDSVKSGLLDLLDNDMSNTVPLKDRLAFARFIKR